MDEPKQIEFRQAGKSSIEEHALTTSFVTHRKFWPETRSINFFSATSLINASVSLLIRKPNRSSNRIARNILVGSSIKLWLCKTRMVCSFDVTLPAVEIEQFPE